MLDINKETYISINKSKRNKFMDKIISNIDKYKRCVIEAKRDISLNTLFAFINTVLKGRFRIISQRFNEDKIEYYHIEIKKKLETYEIEISNKILVFDYSKEDIIVINDLKDIGIIKKPIEKEV